MPLHSEYYVRVGGAVIWTPDNVRSFLYARSNGNESWQMMDCGVTGQEMTFC